MQRCETTRRLLSAMLVASACARESSVVVFEESMPEEVAWAGAVVQSGTGDVGTGLLPRSEERFLGDVPTSPDSGTIWVVGFSEEQIASLGDFTFDTLTQTRLEIAGPEDPRLPLPIWAARQNWGGAIISAEPIEPTIAPPITASWIPPCDRLVTEQTVVHFVGVDPCEASARQLGCMLTIDLGSCGTSVSGLVVEGGRTVLEGDGELDRCTATADDPRVFECQRQSGMMSRIELIEKPASPLFEAERFPLSGERLEPADIEIYPVRSGTIFGPALLDRALVVSRIPLSQDLCPAGGPTTSELIFVNPDDGSTTHTATAPGCLGELSSEPEGDRFLAYSALRNEPAVARFDADGRLMKWVALDSSDGVARYFETGRVIGDRVAILLRAPLTTVTEPPGELVVLDRSSLDVLFRVSDLENADLSVFAASSRIGVSGGGTILFFDRTTGRRVDQWLTERLECGLGPTVNADWDSITSRALTSEQRDLNRLVAIDDMNCDGIGFYEWRAATLELLATSDASRWLASVNGNKYISPGDNDRTGIAELDLSAKRFRPGALRFGYGPLRGLVEDAAGTIWGALPWAGELVRIRRTE